MSGEPIFVGYVTLPAAAVVTLSVTIGAWILMRSLRTRSSKWLFGFVVALILWVPVAWAMRTHLPEAFYSTGAYKHLPPYTLIWAEVVGFSLFASGAAVCFLLVVLRVVRPNNSFKPMPLRGSA
ncbi:hypothetical protein [Lysobacter sp. Root983]|uniref:hypothetical protein n=1 Tax=Lysobacter sp. Root983 TaxID=1736613 RepID=UPI0012F9A17C|nr:hypothetical protein [Lysobacter sp. Root983]